MQQLKKIDLDEIWQKEQGWNAKRKSGRKFDDEAELRFWEGLAPHYAERFNLYRDVYGLGDWIHEKFGENQRILDVGSGCGNFTIPMAKYSRDILAVDFSPAMLRELSISLHKEGLTNVKPVHSKWEDFEEPYDADYVLSVNSLYRVCYMREALEKIARYGKKGFIIVRTLLKPYLYSLYDELSLNYRRNNDYMMMPMMFWNMGIHAEVSFTHYDKVLRYADWEAAEKEMVEDLGEMSYLNYNTELEPLFKEHAEQDGNGYVWHSKRIVEVISYFRES